MIATSGFVQSAPREMEPTPLLKASFFCFCLFNLAYYSRFFEWQLSYLHVPLITSSIALLGAAMEGRLLWTFRSKIGVCMGLLTLLFAINIPFSSWRGGSFHTFTDSWLKSLTVFLIAGALIVTVKQCRTALNSVAWGAAIASVLANLLGRMEGGRLQFGRGTLQNSNEMATIMLMGLPFMWLMAADSHAPKLKRLLALGSVASMIYALLRTGSRAGFIGFCVLCLLLFLRASFIGKLALALGGVTVVFCAFTFFPSLMERYRTLGAVVGEGRNLRDERELGSAIESADERRKILIESIKVSMQHPILGVGIGNFASYMASVERAQGVHLTWLGTHNTYTQVSSEAGTPALLCFLGIIVFSFTGLRRVYKRAKRSPTELAREVSNICFALLATLTAYSICIFFDFVAYEATLPLLAGLAVALTDLADNALDAAETVQEAPAIQPQAAAFPIRRRYPLQPVH